MANPSYIEPPHFTSSNTLTRDPVRWTWVIYGFVQAVITVLLATSAISTEVGAIITGVALALYVAVSELFVRPETVPRVPLEELAEKEDLYSRPPTPPLE
jgi:membrane protein YdbS with pleckstrin-like domain